MLTAVEGTYEDGQLTLDETPSIRRARVIVTFVEELPAEESEKPKQGLYFGMFKYWGEFSEEDFKAAESDGAHLLANFEG